MWGAISSAASRRRKGQLRSVRETSTVTSYLWKCCTTARSSMYYCSERVLNVSSPTVLLNPGENQEGGRAARTEGHQDTRCTGGPEEGGGE